jgi:subtilisin family serine protease
MKRIFISFLMGLFCFIGYGQTVHPDYLDGAIWVKLKNNSIVKKEVSKTKGPIHNNTVDLSNYGFFQQIKGYKIESAEISFPLAKDPLIKNVIRIQIGDINKVDEMIQILGKSENVEYAERVPLLRSTLSPNDTYYTPGYQWSLFKVNAASAWDISTGNSSIKVAIVDDAVQITHPDLVNSIYTNTNEVPNNGIDDDNNGYVDDINGYDVANNDNDPNPDGSSYDHGTHVAGISGASSNNNTGVASIGSGVSIVPVKSTNSASVVSHGYEGIYYAVAANADVINMSWGGSGSSTTAENLINSAYNSGAVLVAAAGNDDVTTIFYPAGYANVIAVASSSSNDSKSSFSNYGAWIDISAPGSSILSTVVGGSYDYKSGTSMASPMVAGLAGLMLSHNPGLTQAEVKSCILNTATDIDGLNPSYTGQLGAGRIDALAAMICVNATLNNAPSTDFIADLTTIAEGQNINYTDLSTGNPTSWSWNFTGGSPANFTGQNPPAITYNTAGTYAVALTTSNSNGNDTETKTAYVTVNSLTGCDTITNILDTDLNSFYSWGSGNGYIFGHNYLKTRYVAEKYTNYGPTNVTGAVFNFVKADFSTSASKITIKVWEDAAGQPGNEVYSQDVLIEDFAANITPSGFFPTNISFDQPASVSTSDFYLGFEIYDVAGDTVVLASSEDLTANGSRPNSAWYYVDPANNPENAITDWTEIGNVISGPFEAALHIYPRITANPPVANLTASSTTVCNGEMVQFDASTSQNLSTVEWAINGTGTPYPTGVSPNVVMNSTGNKMAYLLVRNSCGFGHIDSLEITVNATPNVGVNASEEVICPAGSVNLTATGASSYIWSPGASLSCANCPNPIATPTNTTTYSVEGSNGTCSSTVSITIEIDNATVSADFSLDTTTVCVGDVLGVNGSSSNGAQTYSWTFNSGTPGIGSGAISSTVYSTPGNYTIDLEVENACSVTDATSKTIIVVPASECTNSLIESGSDNGILVYYNAQNDELVVNTQTRGTAYVINSAGQKVIKNTALNSGENRINTGRLAKGMYFIATETDGLNPILTKFVK